MNKLYLTSAAILAIIPPVFATSDVEAVAVIKTENGPVRIPASQFNEKQHTLHVADEHHDEHGVPRSYQGEKPAAPVAAVASVTIGAPTTPAAASIAPQRQYGVLQNKNKFFVVDGTNGTPITDVAAFDAKGYVTNKEAWEAITAAAMATAADNGGQAS